MIFNLADLDLVRVLQTLYRHALQAGMGIPTYQKIGTQELSREECEELLMNGAKTIGDYSVITVDYVKGKPIKFEFLVDKKLAHATSYDVRNGKYRFLEALIYEFGNETFIIKRKRYEPYTKFVNIEERKKEIKQWEKIAKEISWNRILPKN